MIAELTGKYRFLSNFWSCYVTYDGVQYPSVENAYQAAKCADPSQRKYFETCKASEAKHRGKVVKMRPDWDTAKVGVMASLLRQKFSAEPLRSLLLATGDEHIEEGNWWGDTFWGTCNGIGENMLGRLLMDVRADLRRGAL